MTRTSLCVVAATLCLAASVEAQTAVNLGAAGALTLPAGVKYLKEYEPLPANLLKSSVYQLASGAILIVNLNKPDGAACAATIDREVKRYDEVKKDPSFGQLVVFSKAERRTVAKRPAFYSEGGSRTPQEAKAGSPFHVGASYLVCAKRSLVALTLMVPKGELSAGDRTIFDGVALSLKP